jgi:ribose transport system ATP-binding protein
VSIAKWLATNAEILIIDEPTIGIDIKTKNTLHELIWDLAANGKSFS